MKRQKNHAHYVRGFCYLRRKFSKLGKKYKKYFNLVPEMKKQGHIISEEVKDDERSYHNHYQLAPIIGALLQLSIKVVPIDE